MQKIAVLLSGSGRTLDNFHERIQANTLQADIQVVVSNVADVLGLKKAEKYGERIIAEIVKVSFF